MYPRGSPSFLLFFRLILVPELSKQVRGTPGMNFHQVSSKSEDLGTKTSKAEQNKQKSKKELSGIFVWTCFCLVWVVVVVWLGCMLALVWLVSRVSRRVLAKAYNP